MKKIELTYYGMVISKKNTKRIIRNAKTGKPMMISNKAALANEHDMINQFSVQTLAQDKPIGKCKISIVIYEPNLQRRDLDNQATSILDALTRSEVIKDDSIKCVKELNVRLGGIDRENPKAIITITEEKG